MRAPPLSVLIIAASLVPLAPGSHVMAAPSFPYPGACPLTGGTRAADFNEDGTPDFVNLTGGAVTLCFNDGAGLFRTSAAFSATGGLLGVGDFNGDGHQDVLLRGPGASSLQIMAGHGDGSLDPAGPPTPIHNTGSVIVTADFNDDGRMDVAGLDADTHVGLQIMLGQIDGAFQVSTAGSTSLPQQPTVGDFDGDGHLDIAIRHNGPLPSSNLLQVYYGVGNGTFDTTVPESTLASVPITISAGRLDGDSRSDLAIAESTNRRVSTLLGQPNRLFVAGGVASGAAIQGSAASVGTADLDANGLSDLLVFDDAGTLAFANLGGGVFEARGRSPYTSLDWVTSDMNRDDRLDLQVTSMYVAGRGDGTFVVGIPYPIGLCSTTDWAVVDLDLDGRQDLVAAGFCPEQPRPPPNPPIPASGYVRWTKGNGAGQFSVISTVPANDQVTGLAIADFNHDGLPDIAAAHSISGTVSIILAGVGGALATPVRYSAGLQPADIATGKFNDDDNPDVAAVNYGTNDVSVFDGLGNGTLGPERRYAAGVNPSVVRAVDLDADGKVDLVLANRGSGSLMILRGDGLGGFAAPVERTTGSGPADLGVGDVNDDGWLDVVVLNAISKDLSVFLGTPGPSIVGAEARIPLAPGGDATHLRLVNIVGDRHLDLATSESFYVGVYRGVGAGSFEFTGHYRLDGLHAAGDFNGDGLPDVVGPREVLLNLAVDGDGDGIADPLDNCSGLSNAGQSDADADGVGDACDNCPVIANTGQADADVDIRGDACDNCPATANPAQSDADLDSLGDLCDNCALDPNREQTDLDGNGVGDVCDLSDGLILLTLPDAGMILWQQETVYEAFNCYRGDLVILKATGQYTQDPATVPLAGRECGLTAPPVVDDAVLAPGEAVFFLVTGTVSGVEASLGTNSAGTPRNNANPCP